MPISKRDNRSRILALEVLHFFSNTERFHTHAHLTNAAEEFLRNDSPEQSIPQPETLENTVDQDLANLTELREHLKAGADRKIHAIKAFRTLFGTGLKESKNCVEWMLGERQ